VRRSGVRQALGLVRGSLRLRLLAICAAIVALAVLLHFVVLELLILPSLARLEHRMAQDRFGRVVAAITDDLDALGITAGDYGLWDTVHDFAAGRYPAFADRYLTPAGVLNLNLAAAAIYDADGRQIFGILRAQRAVTSLPPVLAERLAQARAVLTGGRPDRSVAAYGLLRDVEGQPALLLRVDIPRVITSAGLDVLRVWGLAFLAAGLATLVALSLLLQRFIVRPIGELTRHILAIRRSGDLSHGFVLRRDDEIGTLARAFGDLRQGLETAHRRLQRVLAASPVVIYSRTVAAPGAITFVSDNLARQFGVETVAGSPAATDWYQRVAADDRHALEEACARARAGATAAAQYRMIDAKGVERWVLDEMEPVRDEQGHVVELIGSWTDVTALKHVQAHLERQAVRLRELAQAARAADRAQSAFFAMMSHEVRNPLNGVLGALSLVSDASLPEEERWLLETARESAVAMLAIVNDILDCAKMEAGRLELAPAPFAVRRLVESVTRACLPQARGKGLELTSAVDPSLPATLLGDSGRLRQMLVNLVSNALKFTERGRVSITLAPAPGGSPAVRFAVADTGIGIPRERRGELFEDFTRLTRSGTQEEAGTGLGLAITRRLAEQMGGAVGLESEPGRGSTFWFDVPLPRASAPVEPAEASDDGAPLMVEGRKLRILVADDSRANRLLARAMLERLGCEVEVAGDGAEAVAAAERRAFDLILMDLQMPVLDGIEATRRLRAAGETAPIVALTGNAAEQDLDLAQDSGLTDWLIKPVVPARLRATVATHLRAREARESPRTRAASA
jgi:signal transduction histidine kinase/ActR/RegA family two-component response regulator